MTTYRLDGKKIAVVVADGFEQSEFQKPVNALRDAGAEVTVISTNEQEVKGWSDHNWGASILVDLPIGNATCDDYDGLLLPGGVMNPDTLRQDQDVVDFVRDFFDQGKPVAAICHGPQLLIEADVVEDRKLTSYPSIRTDLENAGAEWVDEEVVVDQGLVTSRSPADIPAFNAKMVEEFAEGIHSGQHA
ncbi:protease I [Verrucomicrobium sp. GAS474]|uniref:type 1 glutamine amidotransferase domain-containing protein n=1 Tax=Verrucomicrobium sp. GAS474 TaxID=1882831 RepID=UPI00087A285B|nr:type 1 glutamine amidotransferase domain-containing protein [Verrucomicrobium sp. GAS474]SDU17809.1 protease I [Verrucomicrobium sp. GAS474]